MPGILLLDLLMAFYPAAHVALSFSDLLPRGSNSAMGKASVDWALHSGDCSSYQAAYGVLPTLRRL